MTDDCRREVVRGQVVERCVIADNVEDSLVRIGPRCRNITFRATGIDFFAKHAIVDRLNDLLFDGGTNAPSLLIAEMALSRT